MNALAAALDAVSRPDAILDAMVTALALSAIAGAALWATADAPPRVRFRIAVCGLAAWVVPWPIVGIALDLPAWAAAGDAWQAWAAWGEQALGLPTAQRADVAPTPAADPARALFWLFLLLAAPGVAGAVGDWRALRASLRGWRARSRSGEALRELLPAHLAAVRVDLRIVEGSRVAAASGFLSPTVWIGARLSGDDLRVALVHEVLHVRRRDPAWLAVLLVLRRLYWWNPVVRGLARHAVVMLEASCDRDCAAVLGRQHYVERLASMMLARESQRAPRLVAAMHGRNGDVERVKRLARSARVRPRHVASLAVLTAAAAVTAVCRVAEPAERPGWSRVGIPATPAGAALGAVLGAFDRGDEEWLRAYLGTFTPQEVSLDLYDWIGSLQLVAVSPRGRYGIDYVVMHEATGMKRAGRLEVAAAAPARVTRSELRTVGPASASPRAARAGPER
ncbi:MAG: hypothetical protein JXB36_07415 [Gammaproteobacteria bacterium]|nr:hypothetical protein [Gammaproteobacteria bacterium]